MKDQLKKIFGVFGENVNVNQIPDSSELFKVTTELHGEFYVCAKKLTFGGRESLEYEQRIQIRSSSNNYIEEKIKQGFKGILLGIFENNGKTILCTFKVKHSNAENTISKQIKSETLDKAIGIGFCQQLKGQEYACAFRPEFLYFYIDNIKWIHDYKANEMNNINQEVIQDMDNNGYDDFEKNEKRNKSIPVNVIVYGAPGTGKTYHTVDRALAIINNQSLEEFENANKDRATNLAKYKELVKEGRIVFTTFHQNYGYEDFIQGLRPDRNSESMKFDIVDGVFKKIADRALNDGDNNYVIIIDEINRANISKVFGELITLIESDKRWGELNEMSTTLQSGDIFAVPNNLYIIGTMNSADKSISLIDVALRRRFVFEEQRPEYSLVEDEKLKNVLEEINKLLSNELESSDLLIGHSYFMNKKEEDLCNILNNSIIPLLYEYFYDNKKKVKKLLENIKNDCKLNDVNIKDDNVGRLRVEKAS